MTTTSPKPSGIVPRPSRRRMSAVARLAIFFAALFVLLGLIMLFRQQFTGVLWYAAEPLSYARNSASVFLSNFFYNFSSSQTLIRENQELRSELTSAQTLLLDRAILAAENLELKGKLHGQKSDERSILGSVIARPPGVPYDILILDIGAKDGVKVGDFVSPGGSIYIGYVAEVFSGTCRVVLFSSPEQTYNAMLVHTEPGALPVRTAISVGGQGGGSLRAEVPAGIKVEVGDTVVFSSIRPEIVAKVVYSEGENDASLRTIYMQLPVSISSLQFVEVRSAVSYAEE